MEMAQADPLKTPECTAQNSLSALNVEFFDPVWTTPFCIQEK